MAHLMRFARMLVIGTMAILPAASGADDAIKVVFRGDDMGVAQAINEACIKSYREGVVRSVEVIAPGAWFLDAARLLKESPDLDVGVHLCLTSEWERCKWRPLTHAPSLVDADGYFYPATNQRTDFSPNSGFLEAKPKLDEVEAELRAQIELTRKHVPRISHVSVHMYTARSTPELEAIARRLARQFNLLFDDDGMKRAVYWGGTDPAAHAKRLITRLETLGAGTHLIITHPGLDTPELRNFGHSGNDDVAEDRAAATAALTSKSVKEALAKQGIQVISYKDLTNAPAPDAANKALPGS
jgi:predicted glycoside hydrolase/deacetylase ChbG (UPF0249 family)